MNYIKYEALPHTRQEYAIEFAALYMGGKFQRKNTPPPFTRIHTPSNHSRTKGMHTPVFTNDFSCDKGSRSRGLKSVIDCVIDCDCPTK